MDNNIHRFEAQHLMHAMSQNNVKRWVALSEGAGGTVGWLTVRRGNTTHCLDVMSTVCLTTFHT
jgi:hypothetical protein